MTKTKHWHWLWMVGVLLVACLLTPRSAATGPGAGGIEAAVLVALRD